MRAAPTRPEPPMPWLSDLGCHSRIFSDTVQSSTGSPHTSSVSPPSTSAMSLLYECVNTVIAGESRLPGSGTGGCWSWWWDL